MISIPLPFNTLVVNLIRLRATALLLAGLLTITTCTQASPRNQNYDPRLKQFTHELRQQYQQQQQDNIKTRFQQLSQWFSPREMEQMEPEAPGLALDNLSGGQTMALHAFLAEALPSTGYLRLLNQLGMASIQAEMRTTAATMEVTSLAIRTDNQQQQVIISGPTVELVLQQHDNHWRTAAFTLQRWPDIVPEAPRPDLNGAVSHYPYLHWRSAQGQRPLQQPAALARALINSLSSINSSQSCLTTLSDNSRCPLPEWPETLSGKLALTKLHGQEQFLAQQLLKELQSHLYPELNTRNDYALAWAGSVKHDSELLIIISSENANWLLVINNGQPEAGFTALPANSITLSYTTTNQQSGIINRDWSARPLPPPQSLAASQPEQSMVKQADTAEPDMQEQKPDNSSEPQVTWLKNPAFLNGMGMALGYLRQGNTLQPVVEVKRDGRPHQNIRVTLSVSVKEGQPSSDSRPWVESLPLSFHNDTSDYRSMLQLPELPANARLELEFSVHEPGTRYEGVYRYMINPEAD